MLNFSRIFFRPDPKGEALYDQLVAQARQPMFFTQLAVPDTVDGRFDIIVLHLCLVRASFAEVVTSKSAEKFLRSMDERFVTNMDHALREIGVGDLSVGKQVKKMMGAYHGRWMSYRDAWGDASLPEVLARNVYRAQSADSATQLADYCNTQNAALAGQAEHMMRDGKAPWVDWTPQGDVN